MSPRDNTACLPTRRRPSLTLRPRARTTAHVTFPSKELCFESWREPSLVEICHEPVVVEEMDDFPEAVPRRRGTKSFSSLRHPMDGLVALGRRLSVSLRNKSSKQTLYAPDEDEDNQCPHCHRSSHKRHISSSWDSKAWNAWSKDHSINRRPSLNSVSALQSFYAPTASVKGPIPGHGLEPPVFPNDVYSGAAARAAAAAQNQMAKAEREAAKKVDIYLTQDSESGIGIDLRDRSELSDVELALLRLGKDSYWILFQGDC
ncbi:hypothetical protein N7474_004068 [Penicillium riverlandense]|uniref:uncharacterized protein n=1 Tax=Penicillium riverlandense TaxID=1903569 RepID=UPI002549B74D|nr:uncharacterized protein N7474_004068 [Penicillium riverlandense]KAJ5818477.1 hypothetical protein N7474_004068 [Penicillium riverlandense]